MRWVLDTGFFLAGMDPMAIGECMITPEVKDEVAKGFPGRKMEYYMDSGLVVTAPSGNSIEKVRQKAEETGDIGRLSDTDISIIALALEMSAGIVSDDYSVQNLCSVLEIPYRSISEDGIKEIWVWKYRCTGCKRVFDEPIQECPVCGSPVRSFRSRSKR